jgi:hypothetical protein
MSDKKQYRLGSAEMVSAPGMVAWAINGAKFVKDRPAMIDVITSAWDVPPEAAMALVMELVPYTIEGETVVFTY